MPPVPVSLCFLLSDAQGEAGQHQYLLALLCSSESELQGLQESKLGRFKGYGQDKKYWRPICVIGSGQVDSFFSHRVGEVKPRRICQGTGDCLCGRTLYS